MNFINTIVTVLLRGVSYFMKVTKKFFKPLFCSFFLFTGFLLILGAGKEASEFKSGNAVFKNNFDPRWFSRVVHKILIQ